MGVQNSLTGALPELLTAERALREKAKAKGIEFEIADYGGLRTEADTVKILKYRDDDWNVAVKRDPSLAKRTTKEKWRPIAKFGGSYHNFGAAFDVKITRVNGRVPTSTEVQKAQDELDKLAVSCGLVSGDSFHDEPHFQLPGSLVSLRERWYAFTGSRKAYGFADARTISVLAIIGVIVFLWFLFSRK